MTPAARVQAAIEILDEIHTGKAAEQALTGWARRSRFAGSKDRAAIRDLVFDTMRCRRSYAALGGGETGRLLLLGALRQAGENPETVFTGLGYAPASLTENELAGGRRPQAGAEEHDMPDWLWPRFRDSLGDQAGECAKALQSRASVHLRVNLKRGEAGEAQASLAEDGVVTQGHPLSANALVITEGARRLRQSKAYNTGLVELQDAASQAVVETLPLQDGMKVLDYCAGGGGKALAMAARKNIEIFAHDIDPKRMRDLPVRAERAGAEIEQIETSLVENEAPYDLIFCDVPCSGSGAWRRSPEGKWRLTEESLKELRVTQQEILGLMPALLARDGVLAYATCSVLAEENEQQVTRFLEQHDDWSLTFQQQWTMDQNADGFFVAHLRRH